jgi:organic radical activating enzyme
VIYAINEIFYSLQGEGARAGEPSVFVRFSGCNLQCAMEPGPLSPGGWVCDTDHGLKLRLGVGRILETCEAVGQSCRWVVLTGGEPGLQVDSVLLKALHTRYHIAIETNGTVELPSWGLDWITVSPKATSRPVVLTQADEVKYVLAPGQALPACAIETKYRFVSPATLGQEIDHDALKWCIAQVLSNPRWRLSLQQHKVWKIR